MSERGAVHDGVLEPIEAWFSALGWEPHAFQRETWSTFLSGRSGLIHVPTGAGKTYAAAMGPIAEIVDEALQAGESSGRVEGVRMLYITPLRAVSRDIELALRKPIDDLGLAKAGVTVESRTGDTSSSVRARQKKRLPTILVTTPESLTLLLTQPGAAERLGSLRAVILDEWHELLSSKRGTQTELAMARLRSCALKVRTWALSATLDNLSEAADAAVGCSDQPVIVSAQIHRPIEIESVLPDPDDNFPWAGHLGIMMLPRVLDWLDPDRSTLVFTNTRSQAEKWFHGIELHRPEWKAILALHHGSIDRAERERVEGGLKDGSIRIVVATSSLDLGVDFAPVERVMQIGSPKGIARLMQRAGRSGHRPGETARIACVPTHGMEMLEIASVRRSIAAGRIEPRRGEDKPMDVLAQHLVSMAVGDGFHEEPMYEEVRTAHAYRDLTREEFGWAMSLVRDGGETLGAYPEYQKIKADDAGVYRVPEKKIAQLHRFNIGTITGDATVEIRFLNGKRIGNIEENFVSRLKRGEKFYFAGRVVAFQFMKDLTAYVRSSSGKTSLTPLWSGSRLPITEALSDALRATLSDFGKGIGDEPELEACRPMLQTQARLSVVPEPDELLIETCTTRDGAHLFVYPYEGRLVHGGLAALIAMRLGRAEPATFSIVANDHGLELMCGEGFEYRGAWSDAVLSEERLAEDAEESVNLSALARLQFREVARVSGLVFQSYPGVARGAKQVQARAGLLYDVFKDFDPDNLLMRQARREVLAKQFEQSRLTRTLARMRSAKLVWREVERPTPFGLPLVAERIGSSTVSNESLMSRVQKMREAWT